MKLSALLGLTLLLLSGRDTARAESVPSYPDIMPVDQVRPGMEGYGLTVFQGVKIERFSVKVVAVVKKGSLLVPGHDMILVRMSGGPMTTRGAFLIRGMSGSPVYINGKIIGAFSQGEPGSKEPLGGVTPIEDMLEAWDPKLPDNPFALAAPPDNTTRTLPLTAPIHLNGRTIRQIVVNAKFTGKRLSSGTTAVLHPCTSFAVFNSQSSAARQKLKALLEPYHVELLQGISGGTGEFKGAPLVPGAAFSMMLVTGDMSMGATGTVTYRKGNRMLGFGHPFMNIGPIQAALCSAYVHDVYPLLSGSYKISSPGPVVGVSGQDRSFSVSGMIGGTPRVVPIRVDVSDLSTGRKRKFESFSLIHPNLYSALISAAVSGAVAEIRSMPGNAMAKFTTEVEAEGLGNIRRENTAFDARAIDGAVTSDLDDILAILNNNPFRPVAIKSVNVKVVMESGRKTAQIERVYVRSSRYAPGENAELGIVIKPYNEPSSVVNVKIPIPADTPSGRYILQVRGGAPASVSFGGQLFRQSSNNNGELAAPTNVKQMMDRFLEKETANDIVVRVPLNSLSINVDGERLPGLPPHIDSLLRSTRSSNIRVDREDLRSVTGTQWVISGQHVVGLTIQRREGPDTPGIASSGANSPPSGSANIPRGPVQDESDNAFAVGLQGRGAKRPNVPSEGSDEQIVPSVAGTKVTVRNGPAPTGAISFESKTNLPPEKSIVRQPSAFRQSGKSDFARGSLDGLTVNSKGELVTAGRLLRWSETAESYIWCLCPDNDGGVWAGTGMRGAVLRVDRSGKSRILARLPETSVHALLPLPDGSILAGTAPHGRTYKVLKDGTYSVFHQSAQKYVMALARMETGAVLIGTGNPRGKIYRVEPNGTVRSLLETNVHHVLSIACHGNDVYAGTSDEGLVYHVGADNVVKTLFDAPEASITSVKVQKDGTLIVATAPRGAVYKITPGEVAKPLLEKLPGAVFGMCMSKNETEDASVSVVSGSNLYRIDSDGQVSVATTQRETDLLAVTMDAFGTVFAATGQGGDILKLDTASSGVFTSAVLDAKSISKWGGIRIDGRNEPITGCKLETRSGNSADPDSTWSTWEVTVPRVDDVRVNSPSARFLQYRVSLAVGGVGPRDVAISYLPKNQAPRVVLQSPGIGDVWSGKQTIKWEASDPDRDTLTYEIHISSDKGKTWRSAPAADERGATPVGAATKERPNPPAESGKVPALDAVKRELDRHPEMPASLREAILERARSNAEGAISRGGQSSQGSSGTRETSRAIDTSKLDDGWYLARVTASDAPSNSSEALAATAISEPFRVCNTIPLVRVSLDSRKVAADKSVTMEGIAFQVGAAINAVQYRVDGKEWFAADSTDGIFDGAIETFRIKIPPLTLGDHVVEIKAFNQAGLTSVEKVTVSVK